MFRRVLVANRGEIAARIIRTLTKMGIESVAIYSSADKNAPYLKKASKAICIGAASPKESYLCENAILQAALQTECEAIHPGFGFLSENAQFSSRCLAQKLQFIGPPGHIIDLMGDKAKARLTFKKAGFLVMDGSDEVVTNIEEGLELAKTIGFPILLKARAGGGGKGMRLVSSKDEFKQKFAEAFREAQSAFKDGHLYVEKFISGARHIEFQILVDSFGNAVHLGERECSIQRNNQKLIEEAPANNFPSALREEIGNKLCKALSKLGYVNAGTVEFLLDKEGMLYFMEMNTRIQVEHPVTELITGIDIVEQQLRIACNEELAIKQSDISFNGSAIECRINAEDPKNNFSPSPGTITSWQMPLNTQLRIDTHVEEGYTVSPFYDSMLAKVIAWGPSRKDAVLLMKESLKNMSIQGLKTTLPFHQRVIDHELFKVGRYDCSFVSAYKDELLS